MKLLTGGTAPVIRTQTTFRANLGQSIYRGKIEMHTCCGHHAGCATSRRTYRTASAINLAFKTQMLSKQFTPEYIDSGVPKEQQHKRPHPSNERVDASFGIYVRAVLGLLRTCAGDFASSTLESCARIIGFVNDQAQAGSTGELQKHRPRVRQEHRVRYCANCWRSPPETTHVH